MQDPTVKIPKEFLMGVALSPCPHVSALRAGLYVLCLPEQELVWV